MPLTTILALFARRLASWARSAANIALFPLVLLRAKLDRRPTIRSVSPLKPNAVGPKLAILCHYDRAGRLREDLRHYIRELLRAGFAIILASNSSRLDPAAREFADRHCAGVMLRRNVGFDFAAWKDALLAYDLPRPETTLLLLANDSLYGPLSPLWPAISPADFSAADIWALTDSWQRRYHLQSYFLMAGPSVLQSAAWRDFWRCVRPLSSKHWVIRRYEIGFSQAMLRAGFRLGALWPYATLLEAVAGQSAAPCEECRDPLAAARAGQMRRIREAIARNLPLNPTSDLWRVLLDRGFPFLKRELLRENPTGIADLFEWRALIAGASEFDPAEILADLARSVRNRAP
jgi:Rhamnan synthesis protein F